ncbi:hypothetical protein RRG08_046259 [Elysia crispata]|uniref:Uncharacterized protein n=1 Tax=Elysia crispata TaxID=231223 RepID=A0AAE0YLJ5_9GAST|nr:hypothetical protein RRG08_046259 [Elysia crispata]
MRLPSSSYHCDFQLEAPEGLACDTQIRSSSACADPHLSDPYSQPILMLCSQWCSNPCRVVCVLIPTSTNFTFILSASTLP